MRVCFFSPSLETLTGDHWRRHVHPLLRAEGAEIVRLTNSWADVPATEDVYATGGGRKASMRLLRRAVAGGATVASAAARVLKPFLVGDILEGLRAADPDVIMCDTAATAAQLRAVLAGVDAPWACISVSDPLPNLDTSFRRYDPHAKVSIVLPTFNGIRYLRESIASCLEQSHRNLELIIVDDGSSAPIADVVGEFVDPRIRFIRHEQNQGVPASLNSGFRQSTGEFCTWTSDDNSYLPDAVEQMVAFMQTYADVDFVYADSFRIDETGVVDPRQIIRARPPETLMEDNYIGACFLYKRQVYTTLGDYDRTAVLAEDYDYWVRISQQFTMQRLFRPLYRYRFHSSSLTARFERAEVERQVRRIRRTHRSRRTLAAGGLLTSPVRAASAGRKA